MDIAVRDCIQPEITSPAADEMPRRLWPAFVIAFAMFVTTIWTALLLWLLSRMILLYFDILF